MSCVSRPAGRLFTGSATRITTQSCRTFHACSSLPNRSKGFNAAPRGPASGQSKVLTRRKEIVQAEVDTEEEIKAMKEHYSTAQGAIIEAGERAIPGKDIHGARFRTDSGRIEYKDDFTIIRPTIDFKVKTDIYNDPEFLKPLAEDELEDAQGRMMWKWQKAQRSHKAALDVAALNAGFVNREEQWLHECKEKGLDPDLVSDPLQPEATQIGPSFLDTYSSPFVAPALPKLESEIVKVKEPDEKDPEGKFDRLKRETRMDLDQIYSLKTKIVVRHRVVNQTRLGKLQSIYCLAISGNQNGMLGIGEGKATEPDEAMAKARFAAIKSLKPIPRYENRTIFGESESKVSATIVKLMSRPPGFGLRVQHLIFEMARAAGISDLAAKVPRSRNKMNTVKATYQALMGQRLPEAVAMGRGKKMVDVRKVYYGGTQALPPSWYSKRDAEGQKDNRSGRRRERVEES